MAITYLIKIKCLECDLHFIVLTWHKENVRARAYHCPECGCVGRQVRWVEETKQEIFELHPDRALPLQDWCEREQRRSLLEHYARPARKESGGGAGT
jgi:hypothetical protein